MRKLILVALLAVGMMAGAQSDYSYSIVTAGDAKGTFWDNADTIENGGTLDAIIRVKSDCVMDLEFQTVFDELSGAATGTITCFGSNDGVTWVTASPTVSGALTADGSIWCKVSDFNWTYCKYLLTDSGTTATSCAKTYYSFRKE